MNPNALKLAFLPVYIWNYYFTSADIILRLVQKQVELATDPFLPKPEQFLVPLKAWTQTSK